MESTGYIFVLGITTFLLFLGCGCITPERLKSRLGLLSDRLDTEILARRDEAQLLKDKLKYIQDALSNRTDTNVEDIKPEMLNIEDKGKSETYENLASVLRRAFADEKRFNERVRRNVADLETSVNGLVKEQLGTAKNISREIVSLRENIKETNGKWKICESEMQNLNERIGNMHETVNSEIQKLDERIGSVSDKIDMVLELVKHEFEKFKSCQFLLMNDRKKSGVFDIYPNGQSTHVRVYCDQVTDGGGWTVIQRRQDGSVDFYREWNDYKYGFGDVEGEFWLGNEYIRELTSSSFRELRIDMEDFDNEKRYAKYKKFQIGSESENYSLFVEGYTGDAGDSFSRHNKSSFSTKDRDNDLHSLDCSKKYKGGWWYHSGCHTSNLNGKYLHGENTLRGQGINWYQWRDFKYSLKHVEMKIR